MRSQCKLCPTILLAAAAQSAAAQRVPIRVLEAPDMRFETGFTSVVAVRELRDMRVIVVDHLERNIQMIDADWATARRIGREGSGPEEYILPSQLIAMWGDSSAVRDGPNSRFMVLAPDGSPAGFLDLHGRPLGARQLPSSWPKASAADEQGRFYGQAPSINQLPDGTAQLIDSAAVQRWTGSSPLRDTVAFVPVRNLPGSTIAGGGVVRLGGSPRAYETRPQWTVAGDGWFAIVYDDPYHAEIIAPDGARRIGPAVQYEPVELTEGHKSEWCENEERPRPWLMGRRGGGPASVQMRRNPCVQPSSWPDHLPPFLLNAVRFSPDGKLWVQRTVAAGEPALFDVIDRNGNLAERVRLPPDGRLVGFGVGSAYVVIRDDLDLEYLVRYSLKPSE